MDYQFLMCEEKEGLAVITLNRPDKRNALSRALVSALHDAVTQAADNPSVRSILPP